MLRLKAPHWDALFPRMMIGFLLCILPLLGIQIAMYTWGTQAVRDELTASASNNVLYIQEHFEDNIARINAQNQYLLNAQDVRELFVYQKNYTRSEYYTEVKRVFNLLQLMRNSNPLIKEIRLSYPRSGTVLVAGMLQRIEQAMDNWPDGVLDNGFHVLDGEYIVGASLPATVQEGSIPAYYLEVVLDPEQIARDLMAFSSSQSEYSMQFDSSTQAFIFREPIPFSDAELNGLRTVLLNTSAGDIYSERIRVGEKEFQLISCHSRVLGCCFGQLLSLQTLEAIPRMFQQFIILFSALTLAVFVLLGLFVQREIAQPTRRLLAAFADTARGRFDTHVDNMANAQEYRQLAESFNSMNDQLQDLVITNYESTISLQHAQLKQLQAQINPHFLYNSFYLLRHMVRFGEPEQCDQFLTCLGRYFQYISESGEDVTTLQHEYRHAQDYLTIQMMRFEDTLRLELAPIPQELEEMPMLRLTLQPLFENVMTHGSWKENSLRVVRLRFVITPDTVRILVEDNGDAVTDEMINSLRESFERENTLAATHGLVNIRKRMILHYGGAGTLEVYRSEIGGFGAMLVIPRNVQGYKRQEGESHG